MGTLLPIILSLAMALVAGIELKRQRLVLRPFVTRASSPVWYWTEVYISIGLCLVFFRQGLSA